MGKRSLENRGSLLKEEQNSWVANYNSTPVATTSSYAPNGRYGINGKPYEQWAEEKKAAVAAQEWADNQPQLKSMTMTKKEREIAKVKGDRNAEHERKQKMQRKGVEALGILGTFARPSTWAALPFTGIERFGEGFGTEWANTPIDLAFPLAWRGAVSTVGAARNAIGRVGSAVNEAINNGGFALSTPYLGDYLASKGAGKFTAWVPFDRPWSKGISWMATGRPTLDGVAASGKPTYNGIPVAMIKSKHSGEGRKLYDAGIKIAQDNGYDGLLVGDHLISAPKSYRTFEHYYPDRTYLDDFGLWSNKNMIQGTPVGRKSVYSVDDFMAATAENPKKTVTFVGAPRYRLERPSTEVSTTTPRGLLSDGPLIARGIPEITAENTVSITPKVNWDADYWFKTISGRNSYSAEEAAELALNIPEYRAIEQRLFNEGKLVVDAKGNIVVKDSTMSPQEYIMRQSEKFQKMNPEHHYTGVPDYYMQDFENNSINVESWTDRLSPSNVREYAFGNFSRRKEILDNIKYFENLKNQNGSTEDIEEWLNIYRNQLKEFDDNIAQMERSNQGKVYDITYPNDYYDYKMDAAGAHWARIPSDIVADAGIPKKYLRPGTMATDDIVYAANDIEIDPVVVNIDNVMDTYDGTLLNETIIPKQIPKKSVLGSTGWFTLEGPNRNKLYRSLVPPFIGLGTLGTMYGVSDKRSLENSAYK